MLVEFKNLSILSFSGMHLMIKYKMRRAARLIITF